MQTPPQPGFLDSLIKAVYPNYFNFKTRTRRSEFWPVYIFSIVVFVALFAPALIFFELYINVPREELPRDFPRGLFVLVVIGCIFVILFLIPGIAIRVRRLHDIGKSGYWALLYLTVIGTVHLFILYFSDSQNEPNEFGPSPKYVVMLAPQDQNKTDS